MSYPDELVLRCAYYAGTDVPTVVECLDRRCESALPDDWARDAAIWAWWVACVIDEITPGDVTTARRVYLHTALGREGSRIRKELCFGRIPAGWAEKLAVAEDQDWTDFPVEEPQEMADLFAAAEQATPQPKRLTPATSAEPGLSARDHEMRRGRISATGATAILRTSPWVTPIQVWQQIVHGSQTEPTERMMLGSILEPAVTARYLKWCADHGEVHNPRDVYMRCETIVGEGYLDWACATPDVLIRLPNERWRIVELKTAGKPRWDEPPAYYRDQVLWQREVLESAGYDVESAWIATIHADHGLDFSVVQIPHLPERAEQMVSTCRVWWENHIKVEIPPDIDLTSELELQARYTETSGAMIDADDRLVGLRAAYETWTERRAQVEDAMATIQGKIKDVIGAAEADGVVFEDGAKITWKRTRDQDRVDWASVAAVAGATPEMIRQHTTSKPGSRRWYTTIGK